MRITHLVRSVVNTALSSKESWSGEHTPRPKDALTYKQKMAITKRERQLGGREWKKIQS